MPRIIVHRIALLVGGVASTPMALAQTLLGQPAVQREVSPILIIALVALGVAFVLGIIALSLFAGQRGERQRLKLIERFIEKGQPVPRELVAPEPAPRPTAAEIRHLDIRRGITLLCWAAGVSIFLFIAFGDPRAAAWGLLFLFPGIGSFIKAWLIGRQSTGTDAHDTPHP